LETIIDIKYEKSSPWLNRTVGGIGLTSVLGDFCYETTTVILPCFLAVLGLPAAILGIIEGIADAMASFTKIRAGFIADKLGYRTVLVLADYELTLVGQALIALAVGCWDYFLGYDESALVLFTNCFKGHSPLNFQIRCAEVNPG
jgi:hypothetical protein